MPTKQSPGCAINPLAISTLPLQLPELPVSPETFPVSQWKSVFWWLRSKKELRETPWIPPPRNADRVDAFGAASLSDPSPTWSIVPRAGAAPALSSKSFCADSSKSLPASPQAAVEVAGFPRTRAVSMKCRRQMFAAISLVRSAAETPPFSCQMCRELLLGEK